MDNSFLAYLQRLELMAFFSGYSLIYVVALFIAGNQKVKNNLKNRLVSLLPFGYAIVGSLYFGLQLTKLYPDFSIEHIKLTIQQPYLIIWALLSILFWIPVLNKKTVLSLIHSLVFCFFLISDLFLQLSATSSDRSILRNDMTVFTISLLLNLGTFALVIFISWLLAKYKTV